MAWLHFKAKIVFSNSNNYQAGSKFLKEVISVNSHMTATNTKRQSYFNYLNSASICKNVF